MSDNWANLTVSLQRAATELAQIAEALPGIRTCHQIEQQAKALDHVSEEAHDGATILRANVTSRLRQRTALLSANVSLDATSDQQADGKS